MKTLSINWKIMDNTVQGSCTYISRFADGYLVRTVSYDENGVNTSEALVYVPVTKGPS